MVGVILLPRWEYSIPGMVDTALALADLQSKGLIRHVGTTNMDTAALSAIVDAGVNVACNQVGPGCRCFGGQGGKMKAVTRTGGSGSSSGSSTVR